MGDDFDDDRSTLVCFIYFILLYSTIGPNINIGLEAVVLFESYGTTGGNISTHTTGNMLLARTCYDASDNCTKTLYAQDGNILVTEFPSPIGSVMFLNFGTYISLFIYLVVVRPFGKLILMLLKRKFCIDNLYFFTISIGSVLVLTANGLFINAVLPKMGFTAYDLTATTYVQLVLQCLTMLMSLYVFFKTEMLAILNGMDCSRQKDLVSDRRIGLAGKQCTGCGQIIGKQVNTLIEVKYELSFLKRLKKTPEVCIREMNEDNLNNPATMLMVELITREMWDGNMVGLGRDARGLSHSNIQVVFSRRLYEPNVLQRYRERRKLLLTTAKAVGGRFKPPEQYDCNIAQVATHALIAETELAKNLDKHVNEFYLYHGTNYGNLENIEQIGLKPGKGGMLGAGIYFADQPVKADQYTGTDPKSGLCCMLLCRVLLGNIAMMTSKTMRYPSKARTPPCKRCRQPNSKSIIDSSIYYDSLISDCCMFREYVVYDCSYVLPEFAVMYRRINESTSTAL